MSAGYGGGHTQSYAGGSMLSRESGAPPPSAHATALDALESAVALPDVFTVAELRRTLRRCNGDVMRSALQLREKHAARVRMRYDALNVGLGPLQAELRKGYAHLLEPAPTLLLQLRFFKPSFAEEKLQRQGVGAADGSSSLEDTRRLCVYLMDLAVEAMEESGADGLTVLVDLDKCTPGHVEAKIVTDVLQLVKSWYPECMRHVLFVNGTALTRALSHVLAHAASERTRQRLHVLSSVNELRHFLPLDAIPQLYGGTYRLLPPAEWMAMQAAIEGVDLTSEAPDEAERAFMTTDARQLNGMQYAACSVEQVVEMAASVLRGPMFRHKSVGVWARLYAILRPEALLLYEHATAHMPQVIVPVNHEVAVAPASFADAPKAGGAFGFRVQVPGVAGGHLLAVGSEAERGNWLQEIQRRIDADAADVARAHRDEEKREREAREFAALNMISFDEESASPQLPVAVGMQPQPPHQQAQSVCPQSQPPAQLQPQSQFPPQYQTQNQTQYQSQPQSQPQTQPQPQYQSQFQPQYQSQPQQPTPFFQGGMAPAPSMTQPMMMNTAMAPAAAVSGGYIVAPTFAQQQQYNMVNPMAMGLPQQQPHHHHQQQQQLGVRPPQPVNLPTMMGQQQTPGAQYGGFPMQFPPPQQQQFFNNHNASYHG